MDSLLESKVCPTFRDGFGTLVNLKSLKCHPIKYSKALLVHVFLKICIVPIVPVGSQPTC